MSVTVTERADGVTFEVHVQPRASREGVVGERGGRLRVALHAPPADGEANAALVRVLSAALHVPRAAVEIVAGAKARTKVVRVAGASRAAVEALGVAAPAGGRPA